MIRIVLYILLLCLTQCKPSNNVTLSESQSLTNRFADSLQLVDLSVSDLLSFANKEREAIHISANKGALDSIHISYDCPNILDKGSMIVFRVNEEIKYIHHTFVNGKQKASTHQYFLYENKLFLAEYLDGYWSFEIGQDTRTDNVSTQSLFYFDGNGPKNCLSKKFIYNTSEDPFAISNSIKYKEVDCNKAKVVLSKFRLIQSILNNPKRENKSCVFY